MRRKSRKWAEDPDNDGNLRNGMAIRLDETYTTYIHTGIGAMQLTDAGLKRNKRK